MSKSPKIKRSFITESELEKYLTYLEVGTQEEAAKKLGLPYPSAISNALTSVDAKIQASIQTVKVALEYEMFRRLGKEYQEPSRRLSYVFDSEKEVIQLPKKQYDLLTTVLEKQKEGTVENFILNCVMEKIKKHKVFK